MNTPTTDIEQQLRAQARAAIDAAWTCDAIPGDAPQTIESWSLVTQLGIFTIQLWEPGPDAPAGLSRPRAQLSTGGTLLLFQEYETLSAAFAGVATKLREIAGAALAPLRI